MTQAENTQKHVLGMIHLRDFISISALIAD